MSLMTVFEIVFDLDVEGEGEVHFSTREKFLRRKGGAIGHAGRVISMVLCPLKQRRER